MPTTQQGDEEPAKFDRNNTNLKQLVTLGIKPIRTLHSFGDLMLRASVEGGLNVVRLDMNRPTLLRFDDGCMLLLESEPGNHCYRSPRAVTKDEDHLVAILFERTPEDEHAALGYVDAYE